MQKKNNVLPFVRKKEKLMIDVEQVKKHSDYTPASITLDKGIAEFLEMMTFEDRNDFLNEVINFFFDDVKEEGNEIN